MGNDASKKQRTMDQRQQPSRYLPEVERQPANRLLTQSPHLPTIASRQGAVRSQESPLHSRASSQRISPNFPNGVEVHDPGMSNQQNHKLDRSNQSFCRF